jgi:ABC-type Zn2+ transport system substrate-binding protein/surface adhesin
MKTVRMYKDPAAAQVMRQNLQEMYIKTFNDNESLRQTWTNKYTASLLQKQTALQKQLAKLNKKK